MKSTLFQTLFLSLLAVSYARTSLGMASLLFDEATEMRSTSESPKIVFSKDWKETLYGTLERGGNVLIEYDASRLPNRDHRYGQRYWDIYAEVKYSEGGEVHSQVLDGPDEHEIMRTTLEIPTDATAFIIWFKHFGYYNGLTYDSNYGANYRFPL